MREIDGINKWPGQYIIRTHLGEKDESIRTPLKETFDTKEEAVKFSLAAGKAKIDGNLI